MLGQKENNRIVHSQSEQADAVFLKNQPSWRHLHKSNPLLLGLLLSMIWSLISLMQRCCSVSLELSASALDWSSIFAENGVYKPRQAGIILEAKTTVFVNPFELEARPRVHTHILQLFSPPKQYFVSPWMFCKQIAAFFSWKPLQVVVSCAPGTYFFFRRGSASRAPGTYFFAISFMKLQNASSNRMLCNS